MFVAIASTPFPGAWDGTGHAAMVDLYARSHFPSTNGWMPEYFGGMPFPNNYPPMTYWFCGLLTFLGVSAGLAVYLLVAVSAAGLVLVSYCLTLHIAKDRTAAIIATLFVILLLVDNGNQAAFGIAIDASLSIGLVSHGLGFLMMLLTLAALTHKNTTARALLTCAGLCATTLTNIHVTITLAALLVIYGLFRLLWSPKRAPVFAELSVIALGSAGITCFWWLPMIGQSNYLPTTAMAPRSAGTGMSIILAAFALAALRQGLKRRDALAVSIAILIAWSVFLTMIDLRHLAPNFPLQPWRLAASGFFLMPIAAAYLLAVVVKSSQRHRLAWALLFGTSALVFTPAKGLRNQLHHSDVRVKRSISTLLSQEHDVGRVLVDTGQSGAQVYAMQSLLGMDGFEITTGIFRESSLGSIFLVPLRNRFSRSNHLFGFQSNIDVKRMRQHSTRSGLRATLQSFDITHLVLYNFDNPQMLLSIGAIPISKQTMPFGQWSVWRLPWQAQRVKVVSRQPILSLTPFSADRADPTDFLRLSEEMLQREITDITLAWKIPCSPLTQLEQRQFKAVLVTKVCHDRTELLSTLGRISETGGVVVATEEVVQTLGTRKGIDVVRGHPGSHAFYESLFAILHNKVPLIGDDGQATVQIVSRARDRYVLASDRQQVPVIIRNTYHPGWQSSIGQVYPSTFGQQFIWLRRKAILQFGATALHKLGFWISIIAASALGAGVFMRLRSSRAN